MYNEFKNPYFSTEDNLEITIGAVKFRDEVITNLRKQIINLHEMCFESGHSSKAIDDVQYKHIKESSKEVLAELLKNYENIPQ